MQALALWHVSPHESRLEPMALEAQAGHVLVRGLYSLVSTGTERLVARGEVPEAMAARMRVPFMQGHFSFPLTYGYSWVGRVAMPGHPLDGQLVQLMHPHQDVIAVPADALRPIPEGIPPLRATLASNVETALNAVWDGRVWPGARVLVAGHGLIGALLTHLLLRIPAVEVHVLEPDPQRAARARRSGAAVAPALPPEWKGTMDVAFHASAAPSGMQSALDSLTDEGTLVELSWYGRQRVTLRLGDQFHVGRLRIRSSQVSRLPTFLPPAWDSARRMQVVWRLLQDPSWDALLPQTWPFHRAPEFFDRLRKNRLEGWAWALAYPTKPTS